MDADIIDAELKEEFKRDFLDQLQEVERLLLKLEEEPENLEYVRDIFRPFHTIKGNAGVIGEVEIQDISQLAETVLDQVRQKKRKLSEDMIEAVFKATDLIKAITERGNAESLSGQINDVKLLLNESAVSETLKQQSNKFQEKRGGLIKIDPDISSEITRQLSLLDNQIIQCKIRRDFEPYLFDIFDNVLGLSSSFEQIASMPQIVTTLSYLENYLTVLNTSDVSYSNNAWELLGRITSDIKKVMYPVLVNSLEIGVCYFNPSDTIDDLNRSVDWITEKGSKAVMINLNRTTPPLIDEIQSLIQLKKNSKIPISYIQRFFGHKQYWRDIEFLMEDKIKIATSFWQALESFV